MLPNIKEHGVIEAQLIHLGDGGQLYVVVPDGAVAYIVYLVNFLMRGGRVLAVYDNIRCNNTVWDRGVLCHLELHGTHNY